MEPALRQKQQIPSLQCHAHEGHVAGVGKALVVRRVRVEITAVQPALGRRGPGAQGFAVVRRGEGEGFLAPDLGEQVVGVVAVQRRQGALGADPDARRDEQRGVEVGRVLDLLHQLGRQDVVAHVGRWFAVGALGRRAVEGGDEVGHGRGAEIPLGGEGLLHVVAVAGDALQLGKMHQGFFAAELEQRPVLQGIADDQWNAVG
ncbi:hypothetical protein D3C84_825710 [compost metagenome]